MEKDWQGKLYCGITLDWNYEKGYVDTSMPNYVAKQLIRYRHKAPKRPQTIHMTHLQGYMAANYNKYSTERGG